MFAGMIAPEKPPLRIAKRTSCCCSLRTLKLGPFVRSPPLISRLDFDPDVAAASSVWQPEQRMLKSSAPACRRGCESGTLIDLPQAARTAAAARQRAIVRLRRVTGAHLTREEPGASRRNPERPGGGRMILQREVSSSAAITAAGALIPQPLGEADNRALRAR